jgi:methionine-rich copper-binding protein CopC
MYILKASNNVYRKALAFILSFILILGMCLNILFVESFAADINYTIDVEYSSSSTLANKLITITADSAAFTADSAYPRLYKGGVLQDVTFTQVESTTTTVSFKIATTLSDGTYTFTIEGPTDRENVASIEIADPSIPGTAPLSKLLKSYNSNESVSITGQYTNFSLGQSSVEIINSSGSTVQTPTVTAVNTTTQTITFTVETGLATGSYDLKFTTGSEVLTKEDALSVLATQSISLGTTNLSSSYDNGTTITVTGTNTKFDSSKTTVKILDDGGEDTGKAGTISVTSVTVLTLPVSTGLTAGTYTVQATTSGTDADAPTATFTVANPTAVLKRSDVEITEIGAAYPDLSLKISGDGSSFQSGSTSLSLWEDGGSEVASAISGSLSISGQDITFTLAGSAAPAAGSYVFKAVTNDETVEVPVTIIDPTISSMDYDSDVVDSSGDDPVLAYGYKAFTTTVTGSNTNFSSNTTVTVGGTSVDVTYTDADTISFSFPVGKTEAGSIIIDADGDGADELDKETINYTIGTQPTISSISPNPVIIGSGSAVLTLTGVNTHFGTGTGNPDILEISNESISNVQVIGENSLKFTLSLSSVSEVGDYDVSIRTNNTLIDETATGIEVITFTNVGFNPISDFTLYTLGLHNVDLVVQAKGGELAVLGTETVEVTVDNVEYSCDNITYDTTENTITFNLPEEVDSAGNYKITITQGEDVYSIYVEVIESYIDTFTPYKINGYADASASITGNDTVTFVDGEEPSIAIKLDGTTVSTITAGNITTDDVNNKLTFNLPTGLAVDEYTLLLSWTSGDYSGETLAPTGNFEVRNEISALALKYDNADAGSALTFYKNQGTFALVAQGTLLAGGSANRSSSATWESTNTGVATVSAGTVTVLAPGTTTISATWDGKSDSVSITVLGPTSNDVSTDGSTTVPAAGTLQLISTANYTGTVSESSPTATETSTSLASWESSDTDILTVNSSGLVTAVGNGTATVTATYLTKEGTLDITISNVTISPSSINTLALISGYTLDIGSFEDASGTTGVGVSLEKSGGGTTVIDSGDITNTTANDDIIEFEPGTLTAGTYTVSVTKGAQTYQRNITVKQSSISLSQSSIITGYSAFNLTVNSTNMVFDNSTRKPVVTILDSESAVVTGGTISGSAITVNESENKITFAFPTGLVAGTYTVKCTWTGGAYDGQTLESDITVQTVTITSDEIYQSGSQVTANIELDQNDITQLAYKLFGESYEGDYTNSATWESGNSAIATVNSAGLVTGTGGGTTTITATYGEHTDTVTVVVTGIPVPTITSIDTSNATLLSGSISGTITVTGTNFSATAASNSVKIYNSTPAQVGSSISVNSATTTQVVFTVPTSLTAGSYTVKVTAPGGNSNASEEFTVTGPTPSPTPTPTPTPEPGEDPTPTPTPTPASQPGVIPAPIILPSPTPELTPTPGPLDTTTNNDGSETVVDETNDKATTTYTGTVIEDIIGDSGTEITIDVSNTDVGKKDVSIESDAVDEIVDSGKDVEISTEDVNILIPNEVFAENSGADIKIEITETSSQDTAVYKDALESTETADIEVKSIIVDFKIKKGDDEVKTFTQKIKIEIPLEASDIAGDDTRKYAAYYLDEDTNQWIYIGGKYNADTGKFEINTDHFTKFTVLEYNKTFTDVPDTRWSNEYVEILAARQITTGISATEFGPTQEVSRAQFATFLVRALGITLEDYEGTFTDVQSGKWYTESIEAAARAGIVTGYSDGTFGPNDKITREQMAVMIMRAYEYMTDGTVTTLALGYTGNFTDEADISSWALDAVKASQAAGIINGMTSTTFVPKETATREQAAKVIILLLEFIGEL